MTVQSQSFIAKGGKKETTTTTTTTTTKSFYPNFWVNSQLHVRVKRFKFDFLRGIYEVRRFVLMLFLPIRFVRARVSNLILYEGRELRSEDVFML